MPEALSSISTSVAAEESLLLAHGALERSVFEALAKHREEVGILGNTRAAPKVEQASLCSYEAMNHGGARKLERRSQSRRRPRRFLRDRWFADSPLEQAGFELTVPLATDSCARGNQIGASLRFGP